MVKHFRYDKVLDLTKKGTGVEDIDDIPIDKDKIMILENISVLDPTTELTYVRIGKMVAEVYRIWEEQKSVPADEVTFTTEEHKITAGQFFRCKVSGGAEGDKIKVHLEGYWTFWRE